MSLKLEQHVFQGLESQMRLADYLGEDRYSWGFDMDTGLLTFTRDSDGHPIASLPVQLIGTESQHNGTWLWAWANEASHIPERLLQGVRQVREEGLRQKEARFFSPELPLEENLGTELSLIVTGHLGYAGFYRGPYEGGALYAAIERWPETDGESRGALRTIRVIETAIAGLTFDHREAVLAFLGEPASVDGSTLTWNLADPLHVEFDEHGRIADISSRLTRTSLPDAPKAGMASEDSSRPWWRIWG
jgi:hypothetical protein